MPASWTFPAGRRPAVWSSAGVALLAAMLAALALAGSARAAATLTNPADRTTVALDKRASFTFRWTLPPGEFGPWILISDTPSYDPDTLEPFEPYCGFDPGRRGTSCRGDADARPLRPGTHYALVTSSDADDQAVYVSPVTRFVVPVRLGFGCSPLQRGCRDRAVESLHMPFGDATYHHPWSELVVRAWTNAKRVRIAYAIRRGHTIVRRAHATRRADGYFTLGGTLRLYGLHGVPAGTRLRCTVSIHAGHRTIRRTVTMRAGAGPRAGTRLG